MRSTRPSGVPILAPMTRSRENRSRQAAFVLCAGALAGILIWSKLRLVTDIPRSAYAEPESKQPADAQGDMSESNGSAEPGSENQPLPIGGEAAPAESELPNAMRTDAARP